MVIPEYWPDFDESILQRCLDEYSRRERRFGLTSEQLQSQAEGEEVAPNTEEVEESLAS